MSVPLRRARDRLGRPVALGSPEAVPDVPELALPPHQALDLAQALLCEGRAFGAHEVMEASWKAAPAHERVMWQALAQLCVGVTHLQRGNLVGAARLLRRGAAGLPADPPYGVDPTLAGHALRLAEQVEAAEQVETASNVGRSTAEQPGTAEQVEAGTAQPPEGAEHPGPAVGDGPVPTLRLRAST